MPRFFLPMLFVAVSVVSCGRLGYDLLGSGADGGPGIVADGGSVPEATLLPAEGGVSTNSGETAMDGGGFVDADQPGTDAPPDVHPAPGDAGADSGGGTSGDGGPAGEGGTAGCVADAACSCAAFQGHVYRLCSVEAIYDDALADCRDHGMTVVRVDSASENDWLVAELAWQSDLVFLGGSDRVVEGQWRWLDGDLFWDGGPVVGMYSNWSSPPVSGGQSDCLGLRQDGTWIARACNSSGVSYACESP